MEQDKLDALASLTTGLYLLTTGTVDEPSGMIVSWVSQVSYEPPLVLAAVRKNRYLHDIIQRSGCFGINVLERGQEDFLPFFKNAPRLEKFKNLGLFKADTGAPLAREALAWLDCGLVEAISPGDHTLFLGRVERSRRLKNTPPMTSQDYDHVYSGRR